jgi:hypothetical protein
MTYRAWTEVVDDPAAPHLVVAHLQPKAADQPAALLAMAIERLKPIGDFALLTRCEQTGPVILCAFTHADDAQTLAAAVEALALDGYPEWASCCAFTLDKAMALAITDAIEAGPPAMAASEPVSVHP